MPAISAVAAQRLRNQCLSGPPRRTAAAVVGWLGAVQAQEYAPARWGLAQRMGDRATDAALQRAFDEGGILRTHVMRPTWHFVTPRDIRWMLELTGPRVIRRMAPYNRVLELDPKTLTRATGVIERALGDGAYLTRGELGARLARAGIHVSGQRLAHVALQAEQEGVVCSGPRRDGQFTYALIALRAPRARRLSRDEALAELTRRYFRSHGPATVRDCVWWSGLLTADVKRGLEMIRARSLVIDGLTYWTAGGRPAGDAPERSVHLLPVYDEYLVAYRDRQAVTHLRAAGQPPAGQMLTFLHALLVRGQVAGTWRVFRETRGVRAAVLLHGTLTRADRRALEREAARYSRFLDRPVSLAIT